MKSFFCIDRSLFHVEGTMGNLSLFSLAIPMMMETLLNNMLGTVNTAVLSDYAESAVAAVGVASNVISLVCIFFTIISTGTMVAIGKYMGAENKDAVAGVGFSAILFASLSALVITPILMIGSPTIFRMMHLEGEILRQAITYFNIRVAFLIFYGLTLAINTMLRCYGNARETVYVGIVINIVNLILNVYVIYFPAYSPITGAKGVAVSCVVGQGVGLLLALCFARRCKLRFGRHKGYTAKYIKEMVLVGGPSGISSSTFALSQTVVTSFIALTAPGELAAKVYFTTLVSYVYLFSGQLGTANSMLVGRLCGAGDLSRADRLNRQLIKVTHFGNLLISVGILLLRKPLLSLFTDDVHVYAIAFGILAVDIIIEQARADSQVYEYALRGMGDVAVLFVVTLISCAVCSVGLSYVLVVQCRLGLFGYFVAVLADELVRAVASRMRWRTVMKREETVSS